VGFYPIHTIKRHSIKKGVALINEDMAKGKVKQVKGKVKEDVGKATGDKSMENGAGSRKITEWVRQGETKYRICIRQILKI
jgi:hypothetical protein